MSAKLADDCFFHDKDRIPHSEALDILKSRVRPVVGIENISLSRAAGRFLAAPIVAPRPIPAHDNAAVDGFAFAHGAYDQQSGREFEVVGVASAGHPLATTPPLDSAVRIFTGAVVPSVFDTVAMQEDVLVETRGDKCWARIPPGLRHGSNRRLAGEDAPTNSELVKIGTRLRPQDVASAAACGLAGLSCFAPLKVAIVSTGDEILRAGAPFVQGMVYDANAPMLDGLVEAIGAEPVDLGVLPDKADLVREALAEVARNYDVLVISGGASRGD